MKFLNAYKQTSLLPSQWWNTLTTHTPEHIRSFHLETQGQNKVQQYLLMADKGEHWFCLFIVLTASGRQINTQQHDGAARPTLSHVIMQRVLWEHQSVALKYAWCTYSRVFSKLIVVRTAMVWTTPEVPQVINPLQNYDSIWSSVGGLRVYPCQPQPCHTLELWQWGSKAWKSLLSSYRKSYIHSLYRCHSDSHYWLLISSSI